jgi:prepilin-type N-terminal cleavage/methylation domain-containing protein
LETNIILGHFLGEIKMKSRKGFTLIELMVVILIVGILAAVAIPIMRGRIDAAKWSEGKAMMGTIATSIRAYHAEKGPTGVAPTTLFVGNTGLGFAAGDLTGTYFVDGDFTFAVTAMDPLAYTITATKASLNPTSYVLSQAGTWTP